MKFLCLCYYDLERFNSLTPDDFAAIERDCRPHDAALRASGHLVVHASLALPESSKTIHPTDGAPSVSDGPYVATNEPYGALFIVDAKDIDEAVAIASLHPSAHFRKYFGGGIEVRALDMFAQEPG